MALAKKATIEIDLRLAKEDALWLGMLDNRVEGIRRSFRQLFRDIYLGDGRPPDMHAPVMVNDSRLDRGHQLAGKWMQSGLPRWQHRKFSGSLFGGFRSYWRKWHPPGILSRFFFRPVPTRRAGHIMPFALCGYRSGGNPEVPGNRPDRFYPNQLVKFFPA